MPQLCRPAGDGYFALVLAASPVKSQVVGAASVCSPMLAPLCLAALFSSGTLLRQDKPCGEVPTCMLLSGRISKGYVQ